MEVVHGAGQRRRWRVCHRRVGTALAARVIGGVGSVADRS